MAGLRLAALGHPLLAPIDLQIDPGELIFVYGPSGSGKSLLLRAIADLDPHGGEVWLDDAPCSWMAPPLWRRRVGLLPAETHWWADSVGEHLADSRSGAKPDTAEVLGWLDRLGFLPEVLSWSVARLSSGERQRLALVRLLAQHPEVLLLDEVTANLDPLNRAQVEALVEDYRRSARAAVLWISHDPAQRARLGGRTYVIRDRVLVPES